MHDRMAKAGILALMPLSVEETEALRLYLTSVKRTEVYDFLVNGFGLNLLEFLDTFAGEQFKVPSRDETIRLILNLRIYLYLKRKGYQGVGTEREGGIEEAAGRRFKKRPVVIRKIFQGIEEGFRKGQDMGIGTEVESE